MTGKKLSDLQATRPASAMADADIFYLAQKDVNNVYRRKGGLFSQLATYISGKFFPLGSSNIATNAISSDKIQDSAVTTAKVENNGVTDAKLRDSAAVSVIGRSANSSGDPADIAAAANDTLLRRVSDAVGFGALTLGMAAANLWTYAKLQQVSATSRFLGRITSGAGDIEELTGAQATSLLSNVVGDSGSGGIKGLVPAPAAGDAAAGKFFKADGTFAVPSGGGSPTFPQGRLTVASGTPVVTSDDTANTIIYYCARGGGTGGFYVPIYDGSAWAMADVGAEIKNTTSNTTHDSGGAGTGGGGPAAVANNSNYDLFVWNDGGTYKLTRGPLWTSDTGRGTGAGTTELEAIKGILTNKVAITNGPGANRGTYVGTIRSNGTASVDWMLRPAAAAGGTANVLGVWNMYNRVNVAATCRESDNSWTYTSTLRALNNSNSNRISFVRGLDEDALDAFAFAFCSQTSTQYGITCIGLDSTSAAWGGNIRHPNNTAITVNNGIYASGKGLPGLGFHYIQQLEGTASSGTVTFYGDNGDPGNQQTGIQLSMLM